MMRHGPPTRRSRWPGGHCRALGRRIGEYFMRGHLASKTNDYEVLAARVGQEQVDQHNANSRARSVLFSSLKDCEFERVSDCSTAREIWQKLAAYHEGTPQVKNRLYETHKREYENLVQLEGESIDSLFARAQSIINKMKANKSTMVLDDHERAIKLLYALDRKIWDVKVNAI